MTEGADDERTIVAVFDGHPGGWVPIGEYGKVWAELDGARAHLQRLPALLWWSRMLWFAAGAVVGSLTTVLALR